MKRKITIKSASSAVVPSRQVDALLIDYMCDNYYTVDGKNLSDVVYRLNALYPARTCKDVEDVMFEEGITLVEALQMLESEGR